ncbi:MAG: hypothetical protein DRR19_33365 [Candidatus Parabeggiatoa sp. nov. 1]|nr:MAG: hypothetical protein DRR19_33365 [Gammaproteobacteria bacterium]
MLFATPTRYGAGLTIWGDYYDLRHAHDTISHFFNHSPMEYGLKEYTLSLSYDIRHAYQRDRQIKKFGMDELDTVEYLGVNVLWPFFLTQVALVRQQAAYVPHTEREQAGLYLLENCARAALLAYDKVVGQELFLWLKHPHSFPDDYLTEYFNHVTRLFATEGKAGKTRFKRLPRLLRTLHPISKEYTAFKAKLEVTAKEKGCSPHELSDWGDWPDFKW